jgi:hypothetical protein
MRRRSTCARSVQILKSPLYSVSSSSYDMYPPPQWMLHRFLKSPLYWGSPLVIARSWVEVDSGISQWESLVGLVRGRRHETRNYEFRFSQLFVLVVVQILY